MDLHRKRRTTSTADTLGTGQFMKPPTRLELLLSPLQGSRGAGLCSLLSS